MAATANKQLPRGGRPARRGPGWLAGVGSGFFALALAATAHAVDWRFEPTLNASAIYTDNVYQREDNPEDALILSATPGFFLRSQGSRRIQASLQYGLTGVTRFGGRDDNDLFHNLNAVGKAELVEDFLFIDGNARVSQELISLLGSTADATVNSSNRATAGTYSISPYIQKRLGTFADAQVRYTVSGAIFENDVADNSTSNAFSAGLTSGTRFNDLNWGLDYSIRKTEYRTAPDATFETVSATAGYALTRKFRVFGTVGEDRNDFLSATETDGAFYSAGFGWSPSRRTSLEASAGERYSGRTYGLSARHRTRLSNWNASYTEGMSDPSLFLPRSGTLYDYQCPGPDGSLVLITDWPFSIPPAPDCFAFGGTPGVLFDLHNGIYISKILRAGVSWGIRRVTYSLNYSDSKRLYVADNSEDRTQSLLASAAYRMTPQTTLNSSIILMQTQIPDSFASTAREDQIVSVTLGVNHRFAEDLSGALTFRHTQRDSDAVNSDYDENRLTATVQKRF